jgi:Domain of unknown function (DUF4271)
MRFYLSVLLLAFHFVGMAQMPADTVLPAKPKLAVEMPFLDLVSPPIYQLDTRRQHESKDYLFYGFAVVLLLLGFLRVLFNKYFVSLFQQFFQTSFKQRQTKDQLLQSPLPSLLLNIMFVIIGGIYLSYMIKSLSKDNETNGWLLMFGCMAGLALVYGLKFFFLRFSGWVFNAKEASTSYTFQVFLVNKILAISLIPVLLLMIFGQGQLANFASVFSLFLIAGLFFYRFIAAYGTVRSSIKISPFHFFIYICAFEIAPLLLIYKGLGDYVSGKQ